MTLQLIRDIQQSGIARRGSAVAIGTFDGVHLGHRAVLAELRVRARELGVPSTVVSFEPLPREVLEPLPPARLMRFREKFEALAATGVERFVCLRFDERLRAMSAAEFVERLLVAGLGARHVVAGLDFRYGYGRQGDFQSLQQAGRQHGFAVSRAADFCVDGERVSSSGIRAALAAGELARAARWLGRPYAMSGRVARGERLGRRLGFPTANIPLGRRAAALGGVFAVRVQGLCRPDWPGVASLGVRPTLGGRRPLLEVNLFDSNEDLYGSYLRVDFIAKLRDELHFANLESMTRQMVRDAEQARAILSS